MLCSGTVGDINSVSDLAQQLPLPWTVLASGRLATSLSEIASLSEAVGALVAAGYCVLGGVGCEAVVRGSGNICGLGTGSGRSG